jgi:cytochrome c
MRDMLDTMTATKVTGALCGALLIFLLGKWAAEEVYHVGLAHGGYGDDDHGVKQAYMIEVEGADDQMEEVVEEADPPVAELLAVADISKGEGEWKSCRSCHSNEAGGRGSGPYLHGVVGRAVGAVDGFGYSGALVAVADTWTPEALYEFLKDPKGYAPGTKMNFKGISDPQDRANLIAWLDSLDG